MQTDSQAQVENSVNGPKPKERWSWKWWKEVYRQHVYSRFLPNKGIYVFDESWDNLIILDACRADTFEEMNHIQGRLERRISRGSSSEEFLIENFAKHPTHKNFPDLVYVSANPYVNSLVPDRFHRIYPVWDYGWDDNLRTVPPENVVKDALQAKKDNPDKRMIIHFMQPHFPPLDRQFEHDTGIDGLRRAARDNLPFNRVLDTTVEYLLEIRELNLNEVWDAYKRNLAIVLSWVEKLIPDLSGKTVITSDHGNMFDERAGILFPFKMSGHKKNFHVRQLVTVPWLIISSQGSSHDVQKSSTAAETGNTLEDDEKIKDRLRKLGYI